MSILNNLISASIVLYHSELDEVDIVIRSYKPLVSRKLFIIDNSEGSTNRYDNYDNIEYIYNGKNIGYGAGHNIGLRKAIALGSKYHIILNPDLKFESSIIDELKYYADRNPDVVYMLPKILYPNGEIQYLCKLLPTPADLIFRRFFPNKGVFRKWNDRYVLKDSGYDKIMNPPCLSGCFMFLRMKAIQREELFFDERFFLYCEDFDYIRRLHRVGKTIFYPKVSITHNHKAGSYEDYRMLVLHIKSAIKYFNKYGWVFDRERRVENDRVLKVIRRSIS